MNRCEFCGKKKKTEGTAFVGQYCIDCHKLNIEQSQEAIKNLKSPVDLNGGGRCG